MHAKRCLRYEASQLARCGFDETSTFRFKKYPEQACPANSQLRRDVPTRSFVDQQKICLEFESENNRLPLPEAIPTQSLRPGCESL